MSTREYIPSARDATVGWGAMPVDPVRHDAGRMDRHRDSLNLETSWRYDMSRRRQSSDWTETEQGRAAHTAARGQAQNLANELGYDHGIERNDLFKSFHVFMLPMRKNRRGHELSCEVVSCENLDRCQPGHGPKGA